MRVEAGALVITTDMFARAVELSGDASGDDFGWLFDDNWFDLLPGERKVVRIFGKHDCGEGDREPVVLAARHHGGLAALARALPTAQTAREASSGPSYSSRLRDALALAVRGYDGADSTPAPDHPKRA